MVKESRRDSDWNMRSEPEAHPAARAAEYAAGFSSIVKDGLMAMPDRLVVAAVDDEKAIHRMLVAEVSAALRKVSKAVADVGPKMQPCLYP